MLEIENKEIFNNKIICKQLKNENEVSILYSYQNIRIFAFLNFLTNITETEVKYIERYYSIGSIPETLDKKENENNRKNKLIEKKIKTVLNSVIYNSQPVSITLILSSFDDSEKLEPHLINATFLLLKYSGIEFENFFAFRIAEYNNKFFLNPSSLFSKNCNYIFDFVLSEENKIIKLETEGFKIDAYVYGKIFQIIKYKSEYLKQIFSYIKTNIIIETKQKIEIIKEDQNVVNNEEIYCILADKTIDYKEKINKLILENNNYFGNKQFFYNNVILNIKKIVNEKNRIINYKFNEFRNNKITYSENKYMKNIELDRGLSKSVMVMSSTSIEKYVKKFDDIEDNYIYRLYLISNHYSNKLNVLKNENLYSDRYKPLRSKQIEKIIYKLLNKNGITYGTDKIYRLVLEIFNSDGSEICDAITTMTFLFNSELEFAEIVKNGVSSIEFAYFLEKDILCIEPLFLEEEASDIYGNLVIDGKDIIYMNIITKNKSIDYNLIKSIIDNVYKLGCEKNNKIKLLLQKIRSENKSFYKVNI